MASEYFKPGTIYCGDCLDVLRQFPENSVDLIYADPPFFTNKYYEMIWKDGSENRFFDDRWKGGKGGVEHFITVMEPRLRECHRILKSTGSMYLHCDYHANAHLRLCMDNIFGEENFKNEIIWRIGWVSGFKTQKKGWIRNHDTIYYYVKSNEFTFNKEYLPYLDGYVRRDGKVPTGKGVPLEDTWNCSEADKLDSIMIKSFSKEKLGYPTQKPEALLERIIKASSNPTDIVLDPFCGCGTAIAVAHNFGRRWIGVDISPTACNLMEKRMIRVGAQPYLMGMPMTEDELRKLVQKKPEGPFEFQNWVIRRLFGRVSTRKTSDMGIDGHTFEGYPVQVKGFDDVGRNPVDNFETALRRVGAKRGVFVAFSFGKGAYIEVARAKLHDGLNIELLEVSNLIKNQRVISFRE